jgi:hypothetical protein
LYVRFILKETVPWTITLQAKYFAYKRRREIVEYLDSDRDCTIYVTRIMLHPLSALFGLQFMLPIEKSVTFTGACANEIIRRNNSVFFLTKGKSEVMLELSLG